MQRGQVQRRVQPNKVFQCNISCDGITACQAQGAQCLYSSKCLLTSGCCICASKAAAGNWNQDTHSLLQLHQPWLGTCHLQTAIAVWSRAALALGHVGGAQQAGSLFTQALSLMHGSMRKANIAGRLSLTQALELLQGSVKGANTAGRLSLTQALSLVHGSMKGADTVCNQDC